jgi:hypothetical protein
MCKAPVTERVNDVVPPERHLMGYVCAFADEAKNIRAKTPSPKIARRAVWSLNIARFLLLDVFSAGLPKQRKCHCPHAENFRSGDETHLAPKGQKAEPAKFEAT